MTEEEKLKEENRDLKDKYKHAKKIRDLLGGYESNRILRAMLTLFDELDETVIFIGSELKIKWLNKYAYGIIKKSDSPLKNSKDMVGIKCWELLGNEKPCDNCIALESMKKNELIKKDNYVAPLSGGEAEIIAIPVPNGEPGCLIILKYKK